MDEASVRKQMQDALSLIISEMGTIRTGRASGSLVEDLKIVAYGGSQELRLNELATITVSDSQTIVIEPWDKSIIGEIRKGILAANIGLNPIIDGQIIRLNLPPMTTEDREKYIKLLTVKVENGKIMLRQIRSEAMKAIKKLFEEKQITQDEKFQKEESLQKITNEFSQKIEETGEKKKEELATI